MVWIGVGGGLMLLISKAGTVRSSRASSSRVRRSRTGLMRTLFLGDLAAGPKSDENRRFRTKTLMVVLPLRVDKDPGRLRTATVLGRTVVELGNCGLRRRGLCSSLFPWKTQFSLFWQASQTHFFGFFIVFFVLTSHGCRRYVRRPRFCSTSTPLPTKRAFWLASLILFREFERFPDQVAYKLFETGFAPFGRSVSVATSSTGARANGCSDLYQCEAFAHRAFDRSPGWF